MQDEKLSKLLETQHSLTEWINTVDQKGSAELQHEDNEKRERLAVISDLTGLPFDRPWQCEATDITDRTPIFEEYLAIHGDELCALRLIPKKPELPKLRNRGLTARNVLKWYAEQDINPADYRADFVPHPPDYKWSTIFMVTEQGIQGEIIWGGHNQLTQGFHDSTKPIVFHYDFTQPRLLPENAQAEQHILEIINHLHMPDQQIQAELTASLNAKFVNDYLCGYFETSESSAGLWFIDYNRLLPAIIGDFDISAMFKSSSSKIQGMTGSPGHATGIVKIVRPENIGTTTLTKQDILVCQMTSPDYLPLMIQAAGIITDQGGILSHASITARELKLPCIVGTGNATEVLKNGDDITMDADTGSVIVNIKRSYPNE
jgi:phosphohistidine swiveling domain-containing protein